MRWTPGGRSDDLEDRRDEGGGGIGGVHIGIGGFLILLVLSLVFKRDFFSLLSNQGAAPGQTTSQPDSQRDAREEPTVQFVSFVLDDTQKTWAGILQQRGIPYRHAKLVLFRDATSSSCGAAQSATGPFYCPSDKVRNLQGQNPGQGNALSVRLELQADCFAGVWAKSTQQRNLLESGDVESALGAAAAVGDDRLQRMSRGQVSPDSFTHGSSAQRMEWFQRGMSGGTGEACNTFQ